MRLSLRHIWLLILPILIVVGCNRVREDFRLESGATLPANQHIVAVDAELVRGSQVAGDLNITASDVIIGGIIHGDLTVAAGNLTLEDSAVIEGNLIYCLVRDGEFRQGEQTVIWGKVQNNCNEATSAVQLSDTQTPWWIILFSNIGVSLLAGLIAALTNIFLPHHMNRIQNAAQKHGLVAFGLGSLSLVTLIGLSSLWGLSLQIILPVVLAPVLMSAWLAVLSLSILGSVSLAMPFGAWLTRVFRLKSTAPILAATLGSASLAFLILFWQLTPLTFMTLILGGVLGLWGLGAALLTRAGRLTYR